MPCLASDGAIPSEQKPVRYEAKVRAYPGHAARAYQISDFGYSTLVISSPTLRKAYFVHRS
jgi:hypothetical protein